MISFSPTLKDRRNMSSQDRVHPGGIKEEHKPDGLLITLRWYSGHTIISTILIGGVLASFWMRWINAPWPWKPSEIFGVLLFSAAGLFLAYSCIAQFLNSTKIEIGAGRMRVAVGPIPWKGAMELRLDDVRGARSQKIIKSSRGSRRTPTRFSVFLELRDGSEVELLKKIRSEDQAAYIAMRLNEVLANKG